MLKDEVKVIPVEDVHLAKYICFFKMEAAVWDSQNGKCCQDLLFSPLCDIKRLFPTLK